MIRQKRQSRHRFIFTRINKRDQEVFRLMIKTLGGVYLECDCFDPSCTHVICKTLVFTEKFLGACATGKWILHESYIHDSYLNKVWLNEEEYEWGKHMNMRWVESLGREALLTVPKQCRLAYGGLSEKPFFNWNVALACKKESRLTYKRLLQCGGATVCYVKLIGSCIAMKSGLTHVIVNEELLSSNKDLLRVVKCLRDLGVACVKEVYIRDYLTMFPKPNIDEYLVPSDYRQPQEQTSKGFMRKTGKSVKTSVKRCKQVKDRHSSDRMVEISTVKQHNSLMPEASEKDQTPMKNVTLPSPSKSLTPSKSELRRVQKGKRKGMVKLEPSQQRITYWILNKKEEQPSVPHNAKDLMQCKAKNNDGRIVANPQHVRTHSSQVKHHPLNGVEQNDSKLPVGVLPTDNIMTSGKDCDVEDISVRLFLSSEQRRKTCSVTETEKHRVKRNILKCSHQTDLDDASSQPSHRRDSQIMHGEQDKSSRCLLIRSRLIPRPVRPLLRFRCLSPIVQLSHVSADCMPPDKKLCRGAKLNSCANLQLPTSWYLPGISFAKDVCKLLSCRVALHPCDKTQPKPVDSRDDVQNEMKQTRCRSVFQKAGHLQRMHKVGMEKVCKMLLWLPAYSISQCHNVVKDSADKIDTSQSSKLVHIILDAVMEDSEGCLPFRVLSAIQSIAASSCYLPASVLGQMMRDILWTSRDERQANIAYATLSHLLELYPPTTPVQQKLYLESLSDYKMANYETKQEWIFICDVLNGVMRVEAHSTQHQYNSFLLLKYITAVLQKDFYKYCTSHPEHGTPLIAQIVWPNGYRQLNSTCLDMITVLINAVKTVGLPRKLETIELVQSFIAMIAHCLAFSDPLSCCPTLSGLTLTATLFVRRLACTINDQLEERCHLKLILNTMLSPWLVFKVTHTILDLYNKSLLAFDYSDYDERLNTLKALLTFYMNLIPLTDSEAKYIHHKTESPLQSTKNKISVPSVKFEKTRMDETDGNSVKKTEIFQQLLSKRMKLKPLNVNKKNCKGETRLHRACIKNDVTYLKLLLNTPGVNVNAADYAGWTPLHEACNHGNVECLIELLTYRPASCVTSFCKQEKENTEAVDIYATNHDGLSALHDAVMNDHVDVARILIEHGGRKLVRLKTNVGETALDLACSDEMRQLLQSTEFPLFPASSGPTTGGLSQMFSEEKTCDDATQKREFFHVIEDKSKELEKLGCNISSSQCEIYVLLVYHLIVSYLEHYSVTELDNQLNRNGSTSSYHRAGILSPNAMNERGLLPEARSADLKTVKRMKNVVCDFEKHLTRLCENLSKETCCLLSLMHVMADCLASD